MYAAKPIATHWSVLDGSVQKFNYNFFKIQIIYSDSNVCK